MARGMKCEELHQIVTWEELIKRMKERMGEREYQQWLERLLKYYGYDIIVRPDKKRDDVEWSEE